jgi:ankyrin repeat protein
MKIVWYVKSIVFCSFVIFFSRALSMEKPPAANEEEMTLVEQFHKVVHNGELDDIVSLSQQDKTLITFRDKLGNSWMHAAAMKGRADIIGWFVGQEPSLIHASNDLGQTPLHMAALHGHHGVIHLFKLHHADFNVRDVNGATPLYLAVLNSHKQTMENLVANGAKVGLHTAHKETPLHAAAANNNAQLIGWLVSQGAPANPKNDQDRTPLFPAVSHGHCDALNALLENCADATLRDNDDQSLLHEAAAHDHVKIIRRLLECGLEPDSTDNNGITPLMIADRLNKQEVCEILREWSRTNRPGGQPARPLSVSVERAVARSDGQLPHSPSIIRSDLWRGGPILASFVIVALLAYIVGRSGHLSHLV